MKREGLLKRETDNSLYIILQSQWAKCAKLVPKFTCVRKIMYKSSIIDPLTV